MFFCFLLLILVFLEKIRNYIDKLLGNKKNSILISIFLVFISAKIYLNQKINLFYIVLFFVFI